jgi:hypothetical protein
MSKPLKVELRKEDGYWSVYVNGVRTVDRESFSVADRIKQQLEHPTSDHSEAGEVAESIRKHFTRNPSQRIRSTRRRGVLGAKRLRGRARVDMMGGTLGEANFHTVQVKRDTAWITLAGFPRGEFGRARAVDYGKLLARRYPRHQFRVFWPDAKKNPRGRELTLYQWRQKNSSVVVQPRGNTGVLRVFSTDPELWNLADYFVSSTASGPSVILLPHARTALHWPDEALDYPRKNPRRRKKNPAPRADNGRGGAAGPEINAAARLFSQFTGHKVSRGERVRLPAHSVGLAIGSVLGISYETTRDGKREKYLHEFRRGARPTLAASSDGHQLYLLRGAYRFTERGIVDKR